MQEAKSSVKVLSLQALSHGKGFVVQIAAEFAG